MDTRGNDRSGIRLAEALPNHSLEKLRKTHRPSPAPTDMGILRSIEPQRVAKFLVERERYELQV